MSSANVFSVEAFAAADAFGLWVKAWAWKSVW
jgi:hypothetical protein